jgi:hypothetical protein
MELAFPGLADNTSAAVDAVEGGLWRLTQDELVALVSTTSRSLAQAEALHLVAVAELEARGVALAVGASDTKTWLRSTLNLSPSQAAQRARMSVAITGPAADTGRALAAGEIHGEHGRVITQMLNGLPAKADLEDYAFAQKVLLEAAHSVDGPRLRKLRQSLHDAIDPDGPEPSDARKARSAHVRDNHDGTETLTWTDTTDVMAMVRAVVEKHYAAKQGEPDETPAAPGQRRADALREAIALVLRTGKLPIRRGQRPQVHVTMTADTFIGTAEHPVATTATGQTLTPDQVRQIACDCDVTPIILNGKGVPLFVGRKYRTVTPGQWAALVVRDGGCVHPQCDRPPDFCEAHHIIWWENHGNSDLDNYALLCFNHHDFAHAGWQIRMAEDGHPEVIPPPWLDPHQRPRRNEYWRIQRQLTLGIDLRPEK